MNSLRKTMLTLSLLAAVPAMEAKWIPDWVSNFATTAKEAVVSRTPSKERVSKFATNSLECVSKNKGKSTAIGLGAAALIGGSVVLAKRYPEKAKAVFNSPKVAANASKDFVKAAYGRFNNLTRTKKAGVVLGGAAVIAGLSYLTYRYLTNNASRPATV
jgi:hypothetical protein